MKNDSKRSSWGTPRLKKTYNEYVRDINRVNASTKAKIQQVKASSKSKKSEKMQGQKEDEPETEYSLMSQLNIFIKKRTAEFEEKQVMDKVEVEKKAHEEMWHEIKRLQSLSFEALKRECEEEDEKLKSLQIFIKKGYDQENKEIETLHAQRLSQIRDIRRQLEQEYAATCARVGDTEQTPFDTDEDDCKEKIEVGDEEKEDDCSELLKDIECLQPPMHNKNGFKLRAVLYLKDPVPILTASLSRKGGAKFRDASFVPGSQSLGNVKSFVSQQHQIRWQRLGGGIVVKNPSLYANSRNPDSQGITELSHFRLLP